LSPRLTRLAPPSSSAWWVHLGWPRTLRPQLGHATNLRGAQATRTTQGRRSARATWARSSGRQESGGNLHHPERRPDCPPTGRLGRGDFSSLKRGKKVIADPSPVVIAFRLRDGEGPRRLARAQQIRAPSYALLPKAHFQSALTS